MLTLEQGLPFSSVLAHVKPGWNIPLNAVILSFTITCLLALINIGSTVAFNAIGSAALVSILSTYFISISVLIYRRFQGPLPAHRWSLGKAGIFINIGAICWLLTVWVFCFFPLVTGPQLTLAYMNWNCVIYGGLIIVGMVYWFAYGRKVYTPPVLKVERD